MAKIVVCGAGATARASPRASSRRATRSCLISTTGERDLNSSAGRIPECHLEDGGALVLAFGDNSLRERFRLLTLAHVPDSAFPTIVHPSASVSAFATVGPGSIVMQGAIIGSAATVGAFCILNTASSLDHDGVANDFASLGPGVRTGGRVAVGTRSALGIGCIVKHGITIGSDTVVGAGSYVHHDVPDNVVAYGTPARVVRTRSATDPYL